MMCELWRSSRPPRGGTKALMGAALCPRTRGEGKHRSPRTRLSVDGCQLPARTGRRRRRVRHQPPTLSDNGQLTTVNSSRFVGVVAGIVRSEEPMEALPGPAFSRRTQMRARQTRFLAPHFGRPRPASAPSSSRVGGALAFVHALTAFVLLAGILAPFVSAPTVAAAPVANPPVQLTFHAAQKPNTPPPLPRPNAVVVGGDFQTALGCPKDFDKTCDATALQPNDDGTWTGSFPIPPGNYSFNIIVRTDDGDVALGADGLPKPD